MWLVEFVSIFALPKAVVEAQDIFQRDIGADGCLARAAAKADDAIQLGSILANSAEIRHGNKPEGK